jgi:hypothetical protein
MHESVPGTVGLQRSRENPVQQVPKKILISHARRTIQGGGTMVAMRDRRFLTILLAALLVVVAAGCLKIVICKRCVPSRVWVRVWPYPTWRIKWDDLVIKIDPPVMNGGSEAGYYAIRVPSTWAADSCKFIRRDVPPSGFENRDLWGDDQAVYMGDTLALIYDAGLTAEMESNYPSQAGEHWFAFKSEYVDSNTWGGGMPDTACGKVTVWLTTGVDTSVTGTTYYIDCLVGDTYDGWADSTDGGRWDYPIVVGEDVEFSSVDLASFTAVGRNGFIDIAWATETEVGNAGFNLYRSLGMSAEKLKITRDLVAARGNELGGSEYAFADREVVEGITYYYWLEDVDIHGNRASHGPVTARVRSTVAKPIKLVLDQNSPNPFSTTTEIRYGLPEACQVRLSIYDMAGREIRTLVDESQGAGYRVVRWDGRTETGEDAAAGMYFCRIVAGAHSETSSMIFMK